MTFKHLVETLTSHRNLVAPHDLFIFLVVANLKLRSGTAIHQTVSNLFYQRVGTVRFGPQRDY